MSSSDTTSSRCEQTSSTLPLGAANGLRNVIQGQIKSHGTRLPVFVCRCTGKFSEVMYSKWLFSPNTDLWRDEFTSLYLLLIMSPTALKFTLCH